MYRYLCAVKPLDLYIAWIQIHYPWSGLPGTFIRGQTIYIYIYAVVPLDCVLARFYVHYPLSGLPGPVECRQTIYISICAVDPLDCVLHGSMFLTANLFRMEKCSQVAN